MARIRPLAFLLGALGLMGRGAEADDAPPRPMVIAEAKLPEGFPKPGPVGTVIVKEYPAYRLARTRAGGGDGGMFMKLFRHIERNEVKMTAPVEMTLSADGGDEAAGTAMAFLYASPAIGAPGPDPADADVVVEDIPALTVASVGIRGGYGPETFRRGEEQVRGWLRDHPEWEAAGPPRALAYNSPFVPGPFKYAEVQVPVATRPRPAPEGPEPRPGP
ncbi:MAG: heme-binding protein [Planctomycetaceae bacterium]